MTRRLIPRALEKLEVSLEGDVNAAVLSGRIAKALHQLSDALNLSPRERRVIDITVRLIPGGYEFSWRLGGKGRWSTYESREKS